MHSAYANTDENVILHVYLTNQTKDTFTFDGVSDAHPSDIYTIYPSVIKPGETSIITVEKLGYNDIFGHVNFKSSAGIDARLVILDQEQVHFGQPIFNFTGQQHASLLLSKALYKKISPRYLMYLSASLNIIAKQN